MAAVDRLAIVPCDGKAAEAFIRQHHRHHLPPQGYKFCLAVADEAGMVRGVATVGRPVARHLDDGRTLEVTRVATDGCPNACSALYAAAWRAARALGYQRLVTYTLATEPGTSLRAAGWRVVGEVAGRSWSCPSRPRETPVLGDKIRWEAVAVG